MGKVAILTVEQENHNRELAIKLEIKEDNRQTITEIKGKLPVNKELSARYQTWRNSYQNLISYQNSISSSSRNSDEWEIHSIPSNIAYGDLVEDCSSKLQLLEAQMRRWLSSSYNLKWNKIREELAKKFEIHREDCQIQLIVKTEQTDLWKLPWHVWDLLEEYHDVGIGCSLTENSYIPRKTIKRDLVRILAIFGDTTNINLEPDRQVIEKLPHTELTLLERVTAAELIENVRHSNGWDILLFSGHSQTQNDTGLICISDRESIAVTEFKNAIREAISRGLKIAIFNSCDGLALAQELVAKFHIPVAIVMQEIVPDEVAQVFIQEFLSEYSCGQTLSTAVRRAQNRLEQFRKFPGVTLLPLVVQNDAIKLPSWSDLLPPGFPRKIEPDEPIDPFPPRKCNRFGQVILSSLAVSAMVMGVRWFGMLQTLELYAYDRLVQLQPRKERPDPRILVVTVSEEDIKYQDSQGMERVGSLSDKALSQALDELEALNPATIALDIYRTRGFTSEVANRVKADRRFFAICKIQEFKNNQYRSGVEPPPEIARERLVFSDIPVDRSDIVRRQFLDLTSLNASDPCNTQFSLSFLVAQHYLYQQHNLTANHTSEKEWQLGNVVFTKLTNHRGGYHRLDDGGYQILLNYRRGDSLKQVAHSISLTELIEQGISPSLKDRIREPVIIIGTTDKSYEDYHPTPYEQKLPGVFLQAQMTSHILSAVLDDRPLIWYWNPWIEAIWSGFWAIIGGLLAITISNRWHLLLTIVGSLIGILAICFVAFTYSGWIPLIPPVITLLTNTFIVRESLVTTKK